MKITEELSNQICECTIELKIKFNIGIGYSHPMGAAFDDDDDFIIYVDGDYNDETKDFDNIQHYLIENNPFENETIGIMTHNTTDKEQQTQRISDFLINFHQWLKKGELKIEEWRQYNNNVKWKPTADGRYDVERKTIYGLSLFMLTMDDLEEKDPELAQHIKENHHG